MNYIQEILNVHKKLLETNPYCYFELAYTRTTEWMCWLCDKPSTDDANRKVIASGQGLTPEEACQKALEGLFRHENIQKT